MTFMLRKFTILAAAVVLSVFVFLASFALAKGGLLHSTLWPVVPLAVTIAVLIMASRLIGLRSA